MILELFLAWFTEIHIVVGIFAWAGVVATVLSIIALITVGATSDDWKKVYPVFKKLITATVILAALSTIPTIDSLWKVRVGLLKLELSSKENVQAVGGHVEEIVKALECKHLNVNCPEEKKP